MKLLEEKLEMQKYQNILILLLLEKKKMKKNICRKRGGEDLGSISIEEFKELIKKWK